MICPNCSCDPWVMFPDADCGCECHFVYPKVVDVQLSEEAPV